jgi:hypothetical protein
MPLARWPNQVGAGPGSAEWSYVAGVDPRHPRDQFTYAGERPARWRQPAEAQVHLWPGNDWYDQYVGVAQVDATARKITLATPTGYDLQPGRRFYVRNLREELDTPGEWHYDRHRERIDYLPPDNGARSGEISLLDHVIVLDNASHISLEGLTIELSRKAAVAVNDGTNAQLVRCTVRNTGGDGIRISGGTRHRVERSEVRDTGRSGVVLSGGDRSTLQAAEHQVSDSHIHRVGRVIMTYEPAVSLFGVGNRVIGNHIHDTPHAGVILTGNDHTVERNEVHDVCAESADCGALYTGRDCTARGNVIRHNVFHDLYGYGLDAVDPSTRHVAYKSPAGVQAVYLDDAASGFLVSGNTFYRVGFLGIQIGGGRDNVVENSVFVDPVRAILIDDRWPTYNWQANAEAMQALPVTGPTWRRRYPELARPMRRPEWPEGNRIVRNIIAVLRPRAGAPPPLHYVVPSDRTVIDHNLLWSAAGPVQVEFRLLDSGRSGTLPFPEWQENGLDRASVAGPPLFLDPERHDYRLDHRSPALRLGFKPIPYDRVAGSQLRGGGSDSTRTLTPRTYRFELDGTPRS